jgi:hypothetical protein
MRGLQKQLKAFHVTLFHNLTLWRHFKICSKLGWSAISIWQVYQTIPSKRVTRALREAKLSAYCIALKMHLECSPLVNDQRDLLRTYMRTRVRDKRERAKQCDCGQEKPDTFPSHAPILAHHLLRCTCDKSYILSDTSAKMGSSIRRDRRQEALCYAAIAAQCHPLSCLACFRV